MTVHLPTPLRRASLVCLVLALGLLTPLVAPGESPDPKANRDQQIADVEKQIQELQKRLDELKKNESSSPAPNPQTLPSEWTRSLNWRPIGPASMGGRITAIAAYEADPTTYWIATASGGLLKTENNGTTFEHQFDREATVSIGSVCVAPSDRNIVWVGTGENNPRNSVSYGDGVYKSTDGGKTWKNMGLKKTFQIGKIVIHPKNPNIVYVGALGRLYGPNEDRGLYKTTDGGQTWEKVLYIDDKTGIIDVVINPNEPETVLAAAWERQRDGFDSHRGEPPVADGYDAYDPIKKWGKGGGIYRSSDGFKTFHKIEKGLPSGALGRIGLDIYRKNPSEVFAIIDCDKIGMGKAPPTPAFLGIQGEDADHGARITQVVPNSPAAKAGLKTGDVVVAAGKEPIEEFFDLTEELRGKKGGDKLVLKVKRGKETQELTATLGNPRLGVSGITGPGQERFAAAMLLGAFLNDDKGGVRVNRVTRQGVAARAGIVEEDLITSVDKKDVPNNAVLVTLLQAHKPGDKVPIKVLRGKETKELTLTVEEPRGFGPGSPPNPKRPNSYMYSGQAPNVQRHQGPDGQQYGGVYKSIDGGETWTRVNSLDPRPMYFSVIRVDPTDDKYVYVLGVNMYRSKNGGKTFSADGTAGVVHPDQHALWINPKDGRHMIVGCDGGFYATYDRMAHWDFLNNVDIGQFYNVVVDSRQPYHVYGGLQDNGSWGGPSHVLHAGGPTNADWITIGGGDGFVCGVDAEDPDIVYFESQDGNIARRNLRTGEVRAIRPPEPRRQPGQAGPMGRAGRGSQAGPAPRAGEGTPATRPERTGRSGEGSPPAARTAEGGTATQGSAPGARGQGGRGQRGQGGRGGRGGPGGERPSLYRFNWNTPFILSHHNPRIFYSAGNYVFRSFNRGDELQVFSPVIARTGRGTGTALSESPRSADVLYAGTDDGNLWVTRDGGKQWTNVADKVGLPGPRWVASIEASRFADGRAYAVFDAHRSDDDNPYVYVTEDYGQTWKSLRANLPTGSTRVLREDVTNPNLLYLGTEFGIWASIDRGQYWTKINNNLPTVAVHEIAVHPTAGEIVAATHGRSVWILDVTPLRQMSTAIVKEKAHLYRPNTVVRWHSEPSHGSMYGIGNRHFFGQNPPSGAQLYYSLGSKAEKVSLKIVDMDGKTVRELGGSNEPGLHLVPWDLSGGPPQGPFPRGFGGGGRRGGQGRAAQATRLPAMYRVVLTVDGKEQSQTLRVEQDPTLPRNLITDESDEVPGDPDEDHDRDRGEIIHQAQ